MGFKSVNINEAVIEIQKGALIIDVREKNEYSEAHIKDSILVPLSTVSAAKINEINSENKLIIISLGKVFFYLWL